MTQQINLYRPIFRKQEKKFSALAMLQAGVAILAGVAVIYGFMWWHVQELRNEAQRVDKQLASSSKRLQDAAKRFGPGAKSQLLADEVTNLEKQLAARLRVRDLLNRGVFSNTNGYSDFFEAFARQHVSGVWLTSFDITGAGEALRLQGRTTDPARVPRYVQRLASEDAIAGKNFKVFVLSRPDGKNGQPAESPYIECLLRTEAAKSPGRS